MHSCAVQTQRYRGGARRLEPLPTFNILLLPHTCTNNYYQPFLHFLAAIYTLHNDRGLLAFPRLWETGTDGVGPLRGGALIERHGSRSSARHYPHLLLWFATCVITCLAYGWTWGCLWVSFTYWILWHVSTSHPTHPPPYYKHISTTPNITAMPAEASQNQWRQIISDLYATDNMLDLQCKPHTSTNHAEL